MKKRWLRIVLIAVAVLFVILLVLPLLININSYRPKIEADASSALGRQVTVSNLSLSILSGSFEADTGWNPVRRVGTATGTAGAPAKALSLR